MRDLWPESLCAVGMGTADSFLHRTLAKIAAFLYRASDRIVVVTPAFKDYLVEKWRVPPEKMVLVENGVDTELFSPHSGGSDIRKELGAEGKFVVSYIGTIGMAHGLETLVEAASRLRQVSPAVVFLLVGEGAEKVRIISLARARGLTNVHFIDQQARQKIPAYICASDACVVSLKKTELFKTVLPTKMLEFMSCARPVILTVDGHARDFLEKAAAGIYAEPESPSELANAVMRIARDPALGKSLGRNGRRYVLENSTRQRTARTYLDVLEDLLQEGRAHSPLAA